MNRGLVACFLVLASCKGKSCDDATTTATTDVAEAAAAAPIVFDASSSGLTTKYRYHNANDPLGRYMVVVPMTFEKTEVRKCTRDECFAELDFKGDGLEIRAFAPPAWAERHTLDEDKKALAANKQPVTSEKTFEKGWSLTATADEGRTYVYIHQEPSFVSPIRAEIRGPIERKADIDEIGDRLSREFLTASRPKDYCRDLPWRPPEARKQQMQTWLGKISVPDELAAKGKDEKFILTLDEPVCGRNGRAVWEVQVRSMGKPDLSLDLGKHVRAEGYFDGPEGPGDHRPVVSRLSLVTPE